MEKTRAIQLMTALIEEEAERTAMNIEDPSWDDYVADARRTLNTNMDHPEEEI